MICLKCVRRWGLGARMEQGFSKAGFLRGKQRFLCKTCGYKFTDTEPFRTTRITLDVKRSALALYLAGLSFRQVERLLGVSNVTLGKWAKKYPAEVKSSRFNGPEKMEINGMLERLGKTANNEDDCGWLLIELRKNNDCLHRSFYSIYVSEP